MPTREVFRAASRGIFRACDRRPDAASSNSRKTPKISLKSRKGPVGESRKSDPARTATPARPPSRRTLAEGIRRAVLALSRSWPGRILLVVGLAWGLAEVGALPPTLASDAALLFFTTLAGVLIYFSRDLVRWLLFPVRRKLWISYTFVGLIPVTLLGLFFLLLLYVTLGQFGFYALGTNLGTRGAALAGAAREVLVQLRPGSDRETVSEVLEMAAKELAELAPGAAAWYLEREGPAIHRLVGSRSDGPILLSDAFPEWALVPREGVIQTEETEWFGAVYPDPGGGRAALILAPLAPLLQLAAHEENLRILDLWTLYVGDEETEPPAPRRLADPEPEHFAVAWREPFLLEAVPWNPHLGGGTVLLSFGFNPIRLIEGTTQMLADPLAINEAPGSGLLILLALLGPVFLLVWIGAGAMGFRIARSITRSIETLSRGTERVRRGNFGHQVRVDSPDQLGELASSFNIMTAKIADDMERLRRAAQLEQEMETARQSQARLLPPEGSVSVPGFAVAAVCRPAAAVGGDYYDLIRLSPNRLGVVIADVAGTGARAAFYMAELKGLILGLTRIHTSPRQVLMEANRVLHDTLDSRTFITIIYAVFDSATATVTFARAGHSPAIRLRGADGVSCAEALAPGGLGLALDGGALFDHLLEEQTLDLGPGEIWLFFTDGVSEAMNSRSDMFGEERLMRLLEDHAAMPPADLQQRVEDEVMLFTGNETHADDLTMVLVRVT